MQLNGSLVAEIKKVIEDSRASAIRAVDNARVLMYWEIGKRIFEEEQNGKDRADYGAYLIKSLSKELQPEFGSGFSSRQLSYYRQFYRAFPIVNALRSQLTGRITDCSYPLIMRIKGNIIFWKPPKITGPPANWSDR